MKLDITKDYESFIPSSSLGRCTNYKPENKGLCVMYNKEYVPKYGIGDIVQTSIRGFKKITDITTREISGEDIPEYVYHKCSSKGKLFKENDQWVCEHFDRMYFNNHLMKQCYL